MQNDDISISIILPTLNEIENLKILIPEIVEVLKSQNIKDFEIIVVDDNSDDGTETFINSLSEENGKIYKDKRK